SAQAREPEYRLPAQARSFAARWLAERGLASGGFVVLGLGARKSRRQPSAAQVLRWSERWREKYGLETVFTWTPGGASARYPGDDAIAAPVLAAAAPQIHPLRGPIVDALGVIWQAAASV